MEAELVGGLSDAATRGVLVDIRAQRVLIEPDELLRRRPPKVENFAYVDLDCGKQPRAHHLAGQVLVIVDQVSVGLDDDRLGRPAQIEH